MCIVTFMMCKCLPWRASYQRHQCLMKWGFMNHSGCETSQGKWKISKCCIKQEGSHWDNTLASAVEPTVCCNTQSHTELIHSPQNTFMSCLIPRLRWARPREIERNGCDFQRIFSRSDKNHTREKTSSLLKNAKQPVTTCTSEQWGPPVYWLPSNKRLTWIHPT